jgi:hypothetical protein
MSFECRPLVNAETSEFMVIIKVFDFYGLQNFYENGL